jgi:hypothetical protein
VESWAEVVVLIFLYLDCGLVLAAIPNQALTIERVPADEDK